jgi:hypothetical protein
MAELILSHARYDFCLDTELGERYRRGGRAASNV